MNCQDCVLYSILTPTQGFCMAMCRFVRTEEGPECKEKHWQARDAEKARQDDLAEAVSEIHNA